MAGFFVHVVFWVELLLQRRLCLIFFKSWVPGRGHDLYYFFLTQYKHLNFLGPTFCLFCIQLWSWERLHVGRPDFGRPHTDPAPLLAHALHDADADVRDGDLPKVVHNGLPAQPAVEPEVEPEVELALPLGCRWRDL